MSHLSIFLKLAILGCSVYLFFALIENIYYLTLLTDLLIIGMFILIALIWKFIVEPFDMEFEIKYEEQ